MLTVQSREPDPQLRPFVPPVVGNPNAAAAILNQANNRSAAAALNSANCFDLSVLRETSTYDVPRSCGGTKPD